MLKKKFDILNQIDIDDINKVYQDNFEEIIYSFANLQIEWLHNAYNQYKDIDKYLILIKLIHKTLSTYNKHFYKVNFEKFYNSSHVEIEKVSIANLVKELNISKETVRRKLNDLSKDGVIKRYQKKIGITYLSTNPKLKKNVFNLSKLIKIFLNNDKLKNLPSKEIEKKILANYTQYWTLFFNFQIPYILRWKELFKSNENFYIFALCALNEIINSKKISKISKDSLFYNLEYLHDNIPSVQKKTKGLNPTTISELSGIPRATVIRKIRYLLKNDFLRKNEKNGLYVLNNDPNSHSFKLQGRMFKENQKELRIFIKEIINLIKN
tara:strand:- start:307 stop:1278 length:972 start_codon:yes stop_codon:yes gene_type:complete